MAICSAINSVERVHAVFAEQPTYVTGREAAGDQLTIVDNPAEKTHANDLRAMPEVYRPTTAVCLTAPTQHQPSKEAVTP
jgi:hypothetical protein